MFFVQYERLGSRILKLNLNLYCRLKLHGTYVLLRYFGRVASLPNFYGQNAYESVQVIFYGIFEFNNVIVVF